jgi:hypothetical protein
MALHARRLDCRVWLMLLPNCDWYDAKVGQFVTLHSLLCCEHHSPKVTRASMQPKLYYTMNISCHGHCGLKCVATLDVSFLMQRCVSRLDLCTVLVSLWCFSFHERQVEDIIAYFVLSPLQIRHASLDSSIGVTARLRARWDWGSIPDRDKRFFSSPQRPDRLWGPSNLISREYRGAFAGGRETGAWS